MADQIQFAWESESVRIPILRLSGRLDVSSAELLREQARTALESEGRPTLIVDLSGLEFVASTGLATFMLLTEEFAERDGSIVFAGPTAAVSQVIALLNIDQFLKLEDSEEAAIRLIGVLQHESLRA